MREKNIIYTYILNIVFCSCIIEWFFPLLSFEGFIAFHNIGTWNSRKREGERDMSSFKKAKAMLCDVLELGALRDIQQQF